MSCVLDVANVSVGFRQKGGVLPLVKNASLRLSAGQCLGILGESGSGKSMLCKAIAGLLDENFTVEGSIRFEGLQLLRQKPEKLRRLRGQKIGIVLQNPMSCFDPLYRIGEQMEETLAEHYNAGRRKIYTKCIEILELMRIRQAINVLAQYPHQLSGGMLQRVMIGLAVALDPVLIIADEPTTAIDSISQHSIMQEFVRIKEAGQVAMIFVSHDLGVLSRISDDVMVMHGGRVMEQGRAQDIFANAQDVYTRHLIEQHTAVMKRFCAAISPAV